MSTLKPDLFPVQKLDDFYLRNPDRTIKQEVVVEEPKLKIDDLKSAIDEYIKNFTQDELHLYKFAQLSAKTAKHPNDSMHYFQLFKSFFLGSLIKLFPDKDVSEIQESFSNLEISLAKYLKEGNVENTMYIPCILGMYRGLI